MTNAVYDFRQVTLDIDATLELIAAQDHQDMLQILKSHFA